MRRAALRWRTLLSDRRHRRPRLPGRAKSRSTLLRVAQRDVLRVGDLHTVGMFTMSSVDGPTMRTLAGALCSLAIAASSARAAIDTRCIVASGGAAARCVRDYAKAIGDCRSAGNAACEIALRAPDG